MAGSADQRCSSQQDSTARMLPTAPSSQVAQLDQMYESTNINIITSDALDWKSKAAWVASDPQSIEKAIVTYQLCLRTAIYALCYAGTEQQYNDTIRLIAECLFGRANLFEKERKFVDEERDGRAAVSIDPSFVKGYVAVATGLNKANKWWEAHAFLEKSYKDPRLDEQGKAELKKMMDNLRPEPRGLVEQDWQDIESRYSLTFAIFIAFMMFVDDACKRFLVSSIRLSRVQQIASLSEI